MFKDKIGHYLADFLSSPGSADVRLATCRPEALAETIREGDVLLVEGSSRFSTAVKYLTQSTWSHSALCVAKTEQDVELVEADVSEGVRLVSLQLYSDFHTRICRPVGLNDREISQVIKHAVDRVGHQYDLRNVFDLARYLIRTPPIPSQWRRRMLSFGSGDPTRAICSTLIAEAFQSVRYPILPDIKWDDQEQSSRTLAGNYAETLHIRHYSLFAPRDFDISPYFEIVKPTLQEDFDPYNLNWADRD